jgi:glycosyltransferase involved in cell wall biosynthesis
MNEVVIDGVRYLPATDVSLEKPDAGSSAPTSASIGVAVTTHNRPEILEKFWENISDHAPVGAVFVQVDDASSPEADTTLSNIIYHRFTENAGIAKAKNKCIELLMAQGVEHLFIFDDDTWPIADDWWVPYVEHTEPHLMYLFKDPGKRAGQKPLDTPKTLYDDGTMYSLSWPRGCMLYLHRSVVEKVGGYRPEFGRWGWEHLEFSERVHNAGLTLTSFQDVCGSEKLIHCVDQSWDQPTGFKRSVPTGVRDKELKANKEIYEQFKGSSDYVEYRDLPNLVLTVCLTKVKDPQPSRKSAAKLQPEDFKVWEDSIKGAEPVVLSDTGFPAWKKAAHGLNPYIQRWVDYYQHLRDYPAKWVWCTDGTDVEMLREPWGEMEPDTLYVGWEPTVVGTPWMAANHVPYKEWIDANGGLPLLNAGVVGGDHATVMEFCHDMAAEGIRVDHTFLAGDMALFQTIAYSEKWKHRVFTGPLVTSLFKANDRNRHSWWLHK